MEIEKLLSYLDKNTELPASEFVQSLLNHECFSILNQSYKRRLLEDETIKLAKKIIDPLDFFLETQFSFACLIAADKVDAGGYSSNIEEVKSFCLKYNSQISTYLSGFTTNSALNTLRTKMRLKAVKNINTELERGAHVFSLTAPTGSGKTMMLLSLAGEILKRESNKRIIYALPFLSITEQVAEISNTIFKEMNEYIRRIDSKVDNSNFEELQEELDENPNVIDQILLEQFSEDTFDYPIVITTFVRLFETLVSNKNATLLKLSNLANSIFLIDEIQALPPRLYGFFIALLDAFCRKFNSYAIISTATMPNFTLPENNKHDLKSLFTGYFDPPKLLLLDYFEHPLFNRYKVERNKSIELPELADLICTETSSCLVILNTIQDTKDLFEALSSRKLKTKIVLLNTHFTPKDRLEKIARCKSILDENKSLVS
jgi:CRISPR-associated endonuclease/helicase Cas3